MKGGMKHSMPKITYEKAIPEKKYVAFLAALKRAKMTQDEFITAAINSYVEAMLDEHRNRFELLKIWGKGLN
jgi:hypothetical protein